MLKMAELMTRADVSLKNRGAEPLLTYNILIGPLGEKEKHSVVFDS